VRYMCTGRQAKNELSATSREFGGERSGFDQQRASPLALGGVVVEAHRSSPTHLVGAGEQHGVR
jgi:hypothetical protein